MNRKGVTMIDDLMDLSDTDASFTQKFIRDNSNSNGMGKYEETSTDFIPQYQPKQTSYHPRPAPQVYQQPQQQMMQPQQQMMQPRFQQQIEPQQGFEMDIQVEDLRPTNLGIPINSYHKNIHCVDIITHIKDCPVCQKLYNNNEKTVYIIIIIILVIMIGLLIKKLFEK